MFGFESNFYNQFGSSRLGACCRERLVSGRGFFTTREYDRDHEAADDEQRDEFNDADGFGRFGHAPRKWTRATVGKSGRRTFLSWLAGWTISRCIF